MGFSLYDTVVVFDRAAGERGPLRVVGQAAVPRSVMEISTNQVLVRSVSTTITTLLPIVIMLRRRPRRRSGAAPLREFAVALAVGLIVGAYSSLFLAAPVVVALKEREPRWLQIRQRYEARVARRARRRAGRRAAAPSPAGRPRLGPAASGGAAAPAPTWSANHPPRPRKGGKGKKR